MKAAETISLLTFGADQRVCDIIAFVCGTPLNDRFKFALANSVSRDDKERTIAIVNAASSDGVHAWTRAIIDGYVVPERTIVVFEHQEELERNRNLMAIPASRHIKRGRLGGTRLPDLVELLAAGHEQDPHGPSASEPRSRPGRQNAERAGKQVPLSAGQARADARGRNQARVLVLDQDSELRERLRTAAARSGYRAEFADSPAQAMQLFRRYAFDAVVIDTDLGNANPFTLFRQLRDQAPFLPLLFVERRFAPLQGLRTAFMDCQGLLARSVTAEEFDATVSAAIRSGERALERETALVAH